MAKKIQYSERLGEIADTKIGILADDQVLKLLAERKQLEGLRDQYEQAQQERAALTAAEREKAHLEEELEHLNTLISPDKPDEELFHLIEDRKVLGVKLESAAQALAGFKKGDQAVGLLSSVVEEAAVLLVSPATKPTTEKVIRPALAVSEIPSVLEETPKKMLQGSVEDTFGREKIGEGGLELGSALATYLEQIRNDISSIGKILDGLPEGASKNKTFMLEVAKIDPAYAMHYANKDVLKTNEDFNLAVVTMKNERQSGSVLAEMLPEARTGKVVLVAVKQDYRNVRFVLPQMPEYDEIMEKAKKMTLDKVKEMKDSIDALSLIPKVLQKDATFMKKVAEIAPVA
ncbi:MAG: hypothetical protein Q8O53_02205 [Candidatus Moranbacteria bacterium]|nr:hypothetical protein [Candidatus Moranbacteria bacterium]